jgi:protein subunit release factor B
LPFLHYIFETRTPQRWWRLQLESAVLLQICCRFSKEGFSDTTVGWCGRLEESGGEEAGIKSATARINGPDAYG